MVMAPEHLTEISIERYYCRRAKRSELEHIEAHLPFCQICLEKLATIQNISQFIVAGAIMAQTKLNDAKSAWI